MPRTMGMRRRKRTPSPRIRRLRKRMNPGNSPGQPTCPLIVSSGGNSLGWVPAKGRRRRRAGEDAGVWAERGHCSWMAGGAGSPRLSRKRTWGEPGRSVERVRLGRRVLPEEAGRNLRRPPATLRASRRFGSRDPSKSVFPNPVPLPDEFGQCTTCASTFSSFIPFPVKRIKKTAEIGGTAALFRGRRSPWGKMNNSLFGIESVLECAKECSSFLPKPGRQKGRRGDAGH